MCNVLPEYVTKAKVDAAIEALGIERKRLGLQSLEIGLGMVTVTRLVRNEDTGRLIGMSVRTEIPIDRGRHSDDVSLSDDPTELFSDGDTP